MRKLNYLHTCRGCKVQVPPGKYARGLCPSCYMVCQRNGGDFNAFNAEVLRHHYLKTQKRLADRHTNCNWCGIRFRKHRCAQRVCSRECALQAARRKRQVDRVGSRRSKIDRVIDSNPSRYLALSFRQVQLLKDMGIGGMATYNGPYKAPYHSLRAILRKLQSTIKV